MEPVQILERELSFSTWCSSAGPSRCDSGSSVGPMDEQDQAPISSSPRGVLREIAQHSQPLAQLRHPRGSRRDHKHRKRPKPPPTVRLLSSQTGWDQTIVPCWS